MIWLVRCCKGAVHFCNRGWDISLRERQIFRACICLQTSVSIQQRTSYDKFAAWVRLVCALVWDILSTLFQSPRTSEVMRCKPSTACASRCALRFGEDFQVKVFLFSPKWSRSTLILRKNKALQIIKFSTSAGELRRIHILVVSSPMSLWNRHVQQFTRSTQIRAEYFLNARVSAKRLHHIRKIGKTAQNDFLCWYFGHTLYFDVVLILRNFIMKFY